MGIKDFFKKNEEVVDLADLQKRGILQRKIPKKDKEEVIDLSSNNSALGFLGSMASSSEPEKQQETDNSIVLDSTKKQRLKGILRDLKTDSQKNSDRIYKLIERIDLLEKKLDRIERRVGL